MEAVPFPARLYVVIKSRRMRWTGHAARMGKGRSVHKVFVGNLRERDHWETQE
jgi:hypothetical protein